MGKPQRDGSVCFCLECHCPEMEVEREEECPPTIPCPDSKEVMEQRRRDGQAMLEEDQRQAMLDKIMAQAQGEAQ